MPAAREPGQVSALKSLGKLEFIASEAAPDRCRPFPAPMITPRQGETSRQKMPKVIGRSLSWNDAHCPLHSDGPGGNKSRPSRTASQRTMACLRPRYQ